MTSSDLVDGKIGTCLQFDGTDDHISFADFTSTQNTGTCIAWVQTTSNEEGVVWAEATKDAIKPYIMFGKRSNGNLYFGRDVMGGTSNYQGTKEVGMDDGQWHQIAWLSQGSENGNIFYFDTQPVVLDWQDGQNPNGVWFDDQSTDTHSIGMLDRIPLYHLEWDGLLDEIRITDEPLSTAWIVTEYTNQNNPAGFVIIGPEEPGP
jgi:hypothetical protein